jgi:N-acetylneuraminate synthase/N,N'-diacetyllegionaminate synthase
MIAGRAIGPEHAPSIIAELGVNHDGSLERARALVEAAQRAAADAIKLQWFEAERLLSRAALLAAYQRDAGAHDPRQMLRGLQLGHHAFAGLINYAHTLRLHAIVTVFSVELVETAARLPWDAFKTASPDIIHRPLIEALMATGRPLIISTGAATLEEVSQVTAWLGDHPHILMQCVSAYPTPDDEAALAGREALMRINPNALGYSDHTTAIDTGALAVAGGACVLEKHLTLDRSAAGPDHAMSLEPAQFAEYVRLARRAWRMRGPAVKQVLPIEQEVRRVSRQSLTTARPLAPGTVIEPSDLTIKRPGTGLAPHRLQQVIGRQTRCAVEADRPLTEDQIV